MFSYKKYFFISIFISLCYVLLILYPSTELFRKSKLNLNLDSKLFANLIISEKSAKAVSPVVSTSSISLDKSLKLLESSSILTRSSPTSTQGSTTIHTSTLTSSTLSSSTLPPSTSIQTSSSSQISTITPSTAIQTSTATQSLTSTPSTLTRSTLTSSTSTPSTPTSTSSPTISISTATISQTSTGPPDNRSKFEKFEQTLCYMDSFDFNLTKRGTLKVHDCPNSSIVIVRQVGALGNQLWEYAAVWAAAKMTGLKSYVPRCFRMYLDKVFESLTIPMIAQIVHCPLDNYAFVYSFDSWRFKNQSIILETYAQIPKLVIPWLSDLRQEFKFRQVLLDQAHEVLKAVAKLVEHPIYIGVHIRRTNYIWHLKVVNHIDGGADADYFFKAMAYFEKQYPSAVFVVVSDDLTWCKKTFEVKKNVYVISEKDSSPARDLALMSVCNHSIIDYGTYGQWSAFLAGGETIYYKSEEILDDIAQLLPNWHFIP